MLKEAVRAGIPIISTSTTDIIHLEEVLMAVVGYSVAKWTPSMLNNVPSNHVLYALPEDAPTIISKKLHDDLITKESNLILINRESQCLEAFSAGVLETPKSLIVKYLNDVVEEKDVDQLSKAMTGLTIKQMVELIRLTQVMHGSLSVRAITQVRSILMGTTQGLQQVQELKETYFCPDYLEEWITINKAYFINPVNNKLIPRGVIFDGVPGVGKTMGAKYIAKQWGVPLYRLDLSSSLGKYVGESEANLSNMLRMLDREQPCVLLIDEVEKLFAKNDDSGVTSRMLSQLLWWMQEHESQVLTVMTTNDSDLLPKELYRSGRIDEYFEVKALSIPKALEFISKTVDQFELNQLNKESILYNITQEIQNKKEKSPSMLLSHASLVQLVYYHIKSRGLFIKKEF